MFGGVQWELQKLNDRRQAFRWFACKTIVSRLAAVIRVRHEISNEENHERAVDTWGLLAQIDIKFIGLLAVFWKILGDTKALLDMLQLPTIDLARAINVVNAM